MIPPLFEIDLIIWCCVKVDYHICPYIRKRFIADVVTNPKVRPWLAAAIKKGCEVQYGAEMVLGQFVLMGRHMGLEIPDPEDFSMVI